MPESSTGPSRSTIPRLPRKSCSSSISHSIFPPGYRLTFTCTRRIDVAFAVPTSWKPGLFPAPPPRSSTLLPLQLFQIKKKKKKQLHFPISSTFLRLSNLEQPSYFHLFIRLFSTQRTQRLFFFHTTTTHQRNCTRCEKRRRNNSVPFA